MAVAALPGLSPTLHTVAIVVSAASMGALGKLSKDCPPFCPGTDSEGRPRAFQPNPTPPLPGLSLPLCLVLGLSLALLSGCALDRLRMTTSHMDGTNLVTQTSTITSCTMLDANQNLARASIHTESATNGTWAPGISMAGLGQSSSSSNLVQAVTVIVNAAAPLAKTNTVP